MTSNDVEAPPATMSWRARVARLLARLAKQMSASTRGHRLMLGVAALLLLVVVYLFFCFYWSLEPRRFDPLELAYAEIMPTGVLTSEADPLPPGYVTVNTLIQVVETVLEKPGGYLRNNRFPPGIFMDNMPNWELGAILEIRKFASALREDFSRTQSQSREFPSLIEAEARFSFDAEAWLVPSPESQYREGIEFLREYQQILVDRRDEGVVFTVRQDKLVDYLSQVEKRLGSLTIRLRANAGTYIYNPHIMRLPDQADDEQDALDGPATSEKTPWLQVDDVFYEARGSAWALYHLLKALRHDFREILDRQFAVGHMNRALSELYSAIEPMRSPMVLNGREFSLLPNHSLTLSAYLAKSHLAVVELRRILTQPAG